MAGLYKKVLLATISGLLGLALLEGVARRLPDTRQLLLLPSSVPGLAYRIVPGTLAKYGEFLYPINSWGFRHEEFPKEKPSGERRAFILGDSIVFGQGSPPGADFSSELGRGLGQSWRVVNAGVPSYSTCQELALLEGVVEGFSPDLIIVGYAMNDPELARTPFGLDLATGRIAPWWRAYHFLKQRLALPKYVMAKLSPLVARARGHAYYGPPVDPGQEVRYVATLHDPAGQYWKRSQACLAGFGDYSRRTGVPVVVAVFPLTRFLDSPELERVHVQVAAAARGAGLEVEDLRPGFKGLSAARLDEVKGDGMHPSPAGHALAAEAVLRRLRGSKALLAGRR